MKFKTNVQFSIIPIFSTIAIIVIGILVFRFEREQNTKLNILKEQELSKANLITTNLLKLTDNHTNFIKLLSLSHEKKISEEEIYEKGQEAIDVIRDVRGRIEQIKTSFDFNSDELKLYNEILNHLDRYQKSTTSAIEMVSAHISLSMKYMLVSNQRFSEFSNEINSLIIRSQSATDKTVDGFLASSRKVVKDFILIFIVSTSLFFIFSYLIVKKFTQPIIDISSLVGRVNQENNYSLRYKSDVKNIEIDALKVGLNKFLSKIESDQKEIKKYNEKLKQMVDQRTKKLEESEQRIRTIVEATPSSLITTNRRGKILFVNSQTEQHFGYHKDELVGQDIEILVPKHLRDKHRDFRTQFCDHPEARTMGQGSDLLGLRKNGSLFPVEIGLSPLFVDDTVNILATIIDISERKESEIKLIQRQAELEKINSELDSFVYTASHDLRTPLRGIFYYAEILEEDCSEKLDESGIDYVGKIKRAAGHLNKLIDDLLTLSKLSRIRNPYEKTDISKMVTSIIERVEFDLNENKVELKIQGDLPTILCDRIKLGEAFLNLIGNAIKFSSKNVKEPPKIEIGYTDRDNFHEFFVKDNGIGIAPQHHDKIFGIFKRLHHADEYDGTGAGLSIVKRIVDDHNGKVWIDSDEGKGSIFYFSVAKDLTVDEQSLAKVKEA